MKGALMVCGTASNVGKSHFVAGLCRLLARRGLSVSPFKAQNMALNSYVTPDGDEIGRAQGVQAAAAGVRAEAAMNPILLKPTTERTSQVVVMGRPVGHMDAASYQEAKPALLPVVLDALADLRARYDVVVCEGAGSPAEINLEEGDLVNLAVAEKAGIPAVVLGDIDRGGVFAALFGTVELLPPARRALVRAFVINKLRGDPALLGDGPAELERRCGVPTIGVIPFLADVALDAEDSLALDGLRPRGTASRKGMTAPGGTAPKGTVLDVAVLALPRISNFTDLDPLWLEPGTSVRMVSSVGELADPDLVIIPGTKATVADLGWIRERGFDRELARRAGEPGGPVVLGVCGGFQILGRSILDEVESGAGRVQGLGLLDVSTNFASEKVVRQRRGSAMGEPLHGYEIHHGITLAGAAAAFWIDLDDAHGRGGEGARDRSGRVLGTSLHGLFESDGFREAFLGTVARARGKQLAGSGLSFAGARQAQIDRLADAIEANVDLGALYRIIEEAEARA
jgi:adenosylcobyric acid synthase